MTSTPIRAAGKVVGQVRGDVFHKSVKQNHMLRTPPAWALDLRSLDDAERRGAKFVELHAQDGATWRASIRMIRDKGFTFDRGFGLQIGLPLDYWTHREKGEKGEPVQLSLFGRAA